MSNESKDEVLEPWVATFFLPSLSGQHYLCIGDRRDVWVRGVQLTETRTAYDLYVPADALDRADLEDRHPGMFAKVGGADWAYVRVGARALQRAGLAANRAHDDAPAGACAYLN